MDIVKSVIDFLLHIDKYLGIIVHNYGALSYLFLFLVIFCETGLVITPFLPGDSLIFVIGTIAAKGAINVFLLFFILTLAAILGNTVNYWIGNYFGEKVFAKNPLFKKDYLEKTKEFYRKHGGIIIIITRFMPIIRTFAPFVAGIGKMPYAKFQSFNVIGGVVWVAFFLFGGYFFGGIPFVQNHLSGIIYLIVFISFIPPVIEILKRK
jgi:membrane-associated protein